MLTKNERQTIDKLIKEIQQTERDYNKCSSIKDKYKQVVIITNAENNLRNYLDAITEK